MAMSQELCQVWLKALHYDSRDKYFIGKHLEQRYINILKLTFIDSSTEKI